MKTILLVVSLAISAALLASTQTADAQEPTRTATSDLGLDSTAVIGLIGPEPRIVWRATPGVDQFRLTATLQAARVNSADPFCSPPSQPQTITVTVDETRAGSATEFRVTFPPLAAGDRWFVSAAEVRLDALNSTGEKIGTQGGGGVAETMCARPQQTATSTPPLAFPSTGTGDMRDDQNHSAIAAATASILLALGLFPLVKSTLDKRRTSPTRP